MADNVGAELTLHNGANGNALNGNNITQELRFSDADYNEVYNNSVQRFFVQQAKRNVIANNAADTLEVQRVSDSTLDAVVLDGGVNYPFVPPGAPAPRVLQRGDRL